MGCVEPEFPYVNSMLNKVDIHAATAPSTYPGIVTERGSSVGAIAPTVVGGAAGLVAGYSIGKSKNPEKEKEE